MRFKRIRKQSKRPERVLHQKAWKVFSEYIRRRDKGRCCTCGVVSDYKNMNAGHFHHGVLDFDEMNVNCQCVACNKWNHGRLNIYATFLVEKYGLEAFNDLYKRAMIANKGQKYYPWELEAIIAKYKNQLLALT